MVKKYIKKTPIVEAVQWTGYNFDEIQDFVGVGNVRFMRETNPPEIYIITEYQALHPGIGDYVVKNSYSSLDMYASSFDVYAKSHFEQSFEEATK